ncbi:MAG TPA: alcohol dehydrogenase [Halieaceae bacterium]|jgi:NAD(P)-dependent dehydrogenase (short-subunit alcohol dehydrogenase family)|uniref:SDR family NAD(P)-dependent oxidoreductase n=1 Tax=Haliea TaxID=475794 RepID=UPI000C378C12|nr:SDR family NAD(P)-dependent oxidoreductase [Haliea sp.]HBQ38986.1 alcohol dehydrogenase [Halieaceae bacterium]MAD64026.1 alcohol dehydrogenase [Haliea sp.]MAY92431.1 alcohol dehydrogenase [Haliea sp.]MBK40941.1 alcohol dehydrogenase [Haliea sp.]MBP68484.1 alcohol dehydrogenase [Haliea sp.]|tara:strand:- start:12313 stop:13194 length:882 start_codon:yes stop_codon:yes gene_type:complete
MRDFTGKVAVITGGASGVGRSLAFALGRRGARIVVGDVDETAMADIDRALAAEGIEARVAHCDVTSAASLESLANVATEHFGGIQLVFANAGIGAGESGAMWDYSEKDWQWCFNVNIWGVINSIRVFMPRLIAANEAAHFVVTGSGNGALLVFPDAPIYTASKAAVHAITENLHYQVQAAQSPVKVSALFPGPHVVETGLFNSGRVRPEALKKEVEGNASGISSVDDMKRMAAEYGIDLQTTHPDEVAAMAVAGLEEDAFWLLATTPETDEKIRARADMILNRTTPAPNMVGG